MSDRGDLGGRLMLHAPSLSRRHVLKGAAALSGTALLALPCRGMAQDLAPFVHQLGWIKSIQFGGHFAAIEQGYFAEEGIAAEFLAGGPSGVSPETAVATGAARTGDTSVDGTITARLGGLPVKAIAAIMQRAPGAIMSLAEAPIHSLQDMVGRTIAMPDGVRPQLTALLSANGVDPAEVTYVPVGTDPGMLAAGQVDGYYGWATNQGVMLQTRGVDIAIAYMSDLGLPGYAGVIVASDEALEAERDLYVRWLRAEIRGWQWHLDNPEEMAVQMVETYGQRGLDLEAQTAESLMMKDFVPVGDAAEHGLLWIEPAMFAAGLAYNTEAGLMTEGQLTVEDVMTQDLIAEATATL